MKDNKIRDAKLFVNKYADKRKQQRQKINEIEKQMNTETEANFN